MRTILGLCAVVLIAGVTASWRYTHTAEVFGQFQNAPEVALESILAAPAAHGGKTITVRGEVRRQCKVTGCSFSFVAGERSIRVELESIAPHAPQREGRRARVEGVITKTALGHEMIASAVEFL
jgi:uncharacterized protein YdeI (BOF family)